MNSLVRTVPLAAVLGIMFGSLTDAPAAEPSKNTQAIREVLDGKSKEARAAWWGFDPVDATGALQGAINSGAKKVIVEKMSGPWIVDKIQLAGNQELFFEPGVVVVAKKGAFRGKTDALFSAWNKTNVKLTGHGATLRMHRDDYDGPEYTKAEWSHVLNFHGSSNVTVSGLTLAESGGDGIYLGAGRGGATNRNVVIRDVVCDRNYRQGISVITAENLLIENCVLKNTAGTPPAAGIDFEPNHARERLVNCVMRNCTIENNRGYAVHVYARPLDGTSAPISLRIEDCVTRGTNARSISIVTSCGKAGPVKGLIEVINCRFEDVGHASIRVGSKPPGGARVRFVKCTLADPAEKPAAVAPIILDSRHGDLENTGGVEFVDCTIRERVDRPVIKYDDFRGARLSGITGTLVVERQGRQTTYTLDQKLIDKWVPYDPVVEIPLGTVKGVRFEPVDPKAPVAERKLPGHRLRREATYLLYATKGDAVSLRVKHRRLSRYDAKPLPVCVLDPAGKEVARVKIPLGEEAACKFKAEQTGTYTIACKPGQLTVGLVASSHPVSIAGDGGVIQLLGTTGDFYFWVPAETRRFGLRFKGEGEGERLSAAVFDAAGKKRWQRANISTSESFRHEREPAAEGQVWRVNLSRPTVGILEDCYLELRGLPPVLGFSAEGMLRPAK